MMLLNLKLTESITTINPDKTIICNFIIQQNKT